MCFHNFEKPQDPDRRRHCKNEKLSISSSEASFRNQIKIDCHWNRDYCFFTNDLHQSIDIILTSECIHSWHSRVHQAKHKQYIQYPTVFKPVFESEWYRIWAKCTIFAVPIQFSCLFLTLFCFRVFGFCSIVYHFDEENQPKENGNWRR